MIDWFPTNPILVAIISVALNVVVAISGVLPSAFITVGTVGILGFKFGVIILIVGEAIGAYVSFNLYRKGLHKLSTYPKIRNKKNKFLQRLEKTSEIHAFFLIIFLRVLPFIPSGAVTLVAALSNIRLFSFSIASTLGKVPALFIEAYSVSFVLDLKTEWKLGVFIFVIALFLFYLFWKKNKGNRLH